MKALTLAKKAFLEKLSDKWFARYFNHKYSKDKEFRIIHKPSLGFQVHEGQRVLTVPRRSRLHYYQRGLSARLDFLNNEYLGDENIIFKSGDTIIDCGANIGEFVRSLNIDSSQRVIAFEPDPTEYNALKLNIGANATAVNKALWSDDGEIEMFLANETGDSGVYQTEIDQKSIKIPAVRLDSYVNSLDGIGVIRLIKIEAEGAEPEVILGSKGVLERTNYISVDAGPERGSEKRSTLVPVLNILGEYNFKLIQFNPYRVTCLFRNENFDQRS